MNIGLYNEDNTVVAQAGYVLSKGALKELVCSLVFKHASTLFYIPLTDVIESIVTDMYHD